MRQSRPALIAAFALILIWFVMPRTIAAQPQYGIQVGAYGDDASKGNMGVGAEIRTSIAPPVGQDMADSFWVGDNLQNGAFIQFGYALSRPGYYCLYGETTGDQGRCLGSVEQLGFGDVRWFWEYWPNPTIMDFYYAVGPANSTGPDGSWHLYQVSPDPVNGWRFILDGHAVWNFTIFQAVKSRDPAYMVAEEITGGPSTSGSLGPVEFRNLQYRNNSRTWTRVTSLRAISRCGNTNSNCGLSIPYGVTALGPNDIIAGTGEQLTQTGVVLWSVSLPSSASLPSGQGQQVPCRTCDLSEHPTFRSRNAP